ncbi:uncharacterized protein LOC131155576 [Malania oleifera]|uniref:uncharacterized protein LOC131155576 n=1 Tax=Malania oleifera TaxID=397392 RepID=UPI0025AEC79C|nr:uncharacterized protein LOC131155576 [Malania oleifera]
MGLQSSLMAFLCLLLVFDQCFAGDDGSLSAYDVLEEYGFPIGLLPQGIVGYELDRSTGKFTAHLSGTCSFSLENDYKLKYKTTVSGVISKGRLSKLKGVSVKVLLLWFNIVEVVRDGDDLEFSVGIASANFPVDNFAECPQCGCGLDCVNANATGEEGEKKRKIKLNRFVSSS